MKTKITFFFVLFFALTTSAFADKPLSNVLPESIVKELMNENLWDASFDNNAAPEAKDLTSFWQNLTTNNESSEQLVDEMFGNNNTSNPSDIRLPRLYPIKVIFLRYMKENNNSPRVDQIHKAWMSRYISMAITTIELAGLDEYRPILDRFRQRLNANFFIVHDLSPEERTRINNSVKEEHGADILGKADDGHYLVTGLYNEEQKYFGLDFARSVEETLITFAHEVVHAGDPDLDAYRATYESLTPTVIKILSKWLGNDKEASTVALDIVDHIFFETGIERFTAIAESVRKKRMEQLSQSSSGDGGANFEPSDAELATISSWMQAAIGLTVQNEYRAYGYSTVLYAVLKSKYHILAPSAERQAFVEKFMAGDDVMGTYLAVAMNPFVRARSASFQSFLSKDPRDPDSDADSKLNLLRIGKVLDKLELSYLTETETFLRSLNSKIAQDLQQVSTHALTEASILPEWARPGGFDMPSNPFNVLTARITTAQVLRFQQNLTLFVKDIHTMNEPLLTMSYGILDLHDLNLGERKLIGVNYDNSPWASTPDNLDPNLKNDLDTVPLDISKYFTIASWQPGLPSSADTIDGNEVAQNVIRLRTLKSTAWLDQAFPDMQSTVLGTHSFLQRLREGLFSEDEIPAARVKELQAELVKALQISSGSADGLLRMKLLLSDTWLLYNMANTNQWNGIADLLQKKIHFVLDSLDLLGVDPSATSASLKAEGQAEAQQFYSDLKPYQKNCDKNSSSSNQYQLGGFWPTRGPFKIGDTEFPLTIVCYQKQLYLVRQPGDYLNYMTTLVHNGAPEAKIFIGSRSVHLHPMFSQQH